MGSLADKTQKNDENLGFEKCISRSEALETEIFTAKVH